MNVQTKIIPFMRQLGNVVKIGRDSFPIASLEEAVGAWQSARDQYGWRASDAPRCKVAFEGRLYSISYNGRVWDGALGGKEVPMPGRKTCAQHDAEGWKDFIR